MGSGGRTSEGCTGTRLDVSRGTEDIGSNKEAEDERKDEDQQQFGKICSVFEELFHHRIKHSNLPQWSRDFASIRPLIK